MSTFDDRTDQGPAVDEPEEQLNPAGVGGTVSDEPDTFEPEEPGEA